MATKLLVFLTELQASTKAFRPVVTRITDKAGDAYAAEAIRQAPRITGSLRGSIKSHGAKGVKTITVNVTAGGPSSPHDVDYAVFVEKGHATRSGSMVPPNPFMRRAGNKIIPQWENELATVVQLLAAGRPGRAAGAIRR